MSKGKIVLTIDYEIFGNGTGQVKQCLVNPTEEILEIAERHGVPLTIMVEMGEYLAFRGEDQFSSMTKRMKDQLKKSLENDHDLQLHFHPQWLGASYENGKWELSDQWRISELSYPRIKKNLKKAKTNLERIGTSVDPDYECFAFRAGAWGIQPSEKVLRALIELDFKVDSTVAPGTYTSNELTYYDFREAPSKPYWFAKGKVTEESGEGILEVPISTRRYNVLQKVYYKMKRKLNNLGELPPGCEGTTEVDDQASVFKKVFSSYRMFDFCVMTEQEMRRIVHQAEDQFRSSSVIPIVGIGHPKSFNNSSHFEKFIQEAKSDYEFVTFGDVFDEVI